MTVRARGAVRVIASQRARPAYRFTAWPAQPSDPACFFSGPSTSRETNSSSLRSLMAALMIASEQHGQARFEMAKMRAIDAAVRILEKEGVTIAFGVPGAAINPLYSALKKRGSIGHILARHVEGASHMAEGYTRAKAGNIGVCIGTSGPAGTDMITGLYSAIADSIPILCITGQAPRARLYKEDFQAVDIESIAKPLTKWAGTVREPALVPRVFSQAFHVMRSGRPGPVLIDLPLDVQLAEIEFDDETYEPLPVYNPAATRRQIEKALDMLNAAERPLIVAGGGVINADASDLLVAFAEIVNVPVVPTLMGWGAPPGGPLPLAGGGRPPGPAPPAHASRTASTVAPGRASPPSPQAPPAP